MKIAVKTSWIEPGMVVHACNANIWEAETRGSQFADSLSYLVRPLQLSETLFQINNKNGLESRAWWRKLVSQHWEAETGGSRFAASLSYLVRSLQLSETPFQNKE